MVDEDPERAVAALTPVLESFPARYDAHWSRGMHAKLGLTAAPGDDGLLADLLGLLTAHGVDHTGFFRALSAAVRGDETPVRGVVREPAAFDGWIARWRADLDREGRDPREVAVAMDRVNPLYVPRNHRVEEALAAATVGDLAPLERLLGVLARPYDERPGLEDYARPAPPELADYRTFCGT